MKKPIDVEDTFWGQFKTSEQLEEFFRPALEKAAAKQDEMRAKARALREKQEKEGDGHAPKRD